MPPIPKNEVEKKEKTGEIGRNEDDKEEKEIPGEVSALASSSHSGGGPHVQQPRLSSLRQLSTDSYVTSQDRYSSVIENRFAVVDRAHTSTDNGVENEKSNDPSLNERKSQSNSALVQKMALLKVAARSNSVHLPNKKGRNANRPILSLKPPRLDTKKIAIISAHKTPDFSPLSANTLDRAQLFFELCSSLHNDHNLPSWYSEWITLKDATRIRASTAHTFQLLQKLEFERQQSDFYSMKISHAGSNASLNRYADVSPYDHCRVVLNSKKSNYINASFVSSLDEKKRYIATQGPLPATFGDFWSMIWEQNSAVIVMLSKEEESGRLKCHRYWPDKVGETKRYFKTEEMNSICFQIWYSEEIPMFDGSTIIRELIVTRELLIQDRNSSYIPESRMIRIVHFSGWNDHDSCDPRQLISLVDIANEVNSPDMNLTPSGDPFTVGPMVIHCSAGVGRTGTFCTADTMFHYLSNSQFSFDDLLSSDADVERLPKNDLIANTVNNFRRQRPGFVQTSAQYHLLYEVVLLRLGDLFHGSLPAKWETALLQKEDLPS